MRARAPISLVTIWLLFLFMVQMRFWVPNFDTHNVAAVLTWDAMGYYLYLPAQFIYHDLGHLAFVEKIMREYNPTGSFFQAFPVVGMPDHLVMKYTNGLALLWFPFFWLGHWTAGWLDYPQDGFSAPYQIAVAVSGQVYGLLGLGLLRRLLLRYFTDIVVAVTLFTLVLGSNYLQSTTMDSAMSHTYLFTGYAILLWLTWQWHERPRRGLALGIGFTLGLIAIIRPSEIVAVVIPLLWGVGSVAAARAKLVLLLKHWPQVLLLGLGVLLGALPQLLYWKWATGHFIYDSYGDTDQQFDFIKPHVWDVLFSFRKGWLVYSPLLGLALLGIIPLWRRQRGLIAPIVVYFVLNLWVVSAWAVWWYAGSLGQRALVQSYAVLALPWGAAVAWVLAPHRRNSLRIVSVGVVLILLDINLFQHWQYNSQILQIDNMTKEFYFSVFGKTRPTQSDYALLDVKNHLPKPDRFYQPRILKQLDFEQAPPDTSFKYNPHFGFESEQSYHKVAEHRSPAVEFRVADFDLRPGQWLRFSCQVYAAYGAWDNSLTMNYERDQKILDWQSVHLRNSGCVNFSWNRIWFDWPVPAGVQSNDLIRLYAEGSGGPCEIDNLRVEIMEPKLLWW